MYENKGTMSCLVRNRTIEKVNRTLAKRSKGTMCCLVRNRTIEKKPDPKLGLKEVKEQCVAW